MFGAHIQNVLKQKWEKVLLTISKLLGSVKSVRGDHVNFRLLKSFGVNLYYEAFGYFLPDFCVPCKPLKPNTSIGKIGKPCH